MLASPKSDHNRHISQESLISNQNTPDIKLTLKTSVSINSSSINYNQLFLKYCKWSHFFILYLGMWTTKLPSGKRRPLILNIIAILFTTILYTYFVSFGSHYYFLTISSIPTMFFVMTMMTEILTTCMKLTSMYYFIFLFNYPWCNNSIFTHNSFIKNVSKEYIEQRLKSTSIRLKIVFFFTLLSSSYWAYYSCIAKIDYQTDEYLNHNPIYVYKWYTRLILTIALLYSGTFPMFFTVYVISIVFLKYELYIHGLNKMVERSEYQTIRFDELIVEYGKVYRSLHNKSYTLWQIFVATGFVGTFALIWEFIASIVEYPEYMQFMYRFYLVSIVFILLLLSEFIYSASFVTKEFDEFKRLLIDINDDRNKIWKRVNDYDGYLDMNEKLSNIHAYHCFVRYICQYPLNVKLFGWKVSNLNLVRFILFFVIAKGISYSLYSI